MVCFGSVVKMQIWDNNMLPHSKFTTHGTWSLSLQSKLWSSPWHFFIRLISRRSICSTSSWTKSTPRSFSRILKSIGVLIIYYTPAHELLRGLLTVSSLIKELPVRFSLWYKHSCAICKGASRSCMVFSKRLRESWSRFDSWIIFSNSFCSSPVQNVRSVSRSPIRLPTSRCDALASSSASLSARKTHYINSNSLYNSNIILVDSVWLIFHYNRLLKICER